MEQSDVIRALQTLGLNEKKAHVLATIMQKPIISQHEIERATDLQQPVVSHLIKELMNKDWITVSDRIRHNVGRPTNMYKLMQSPEIIAKQLRDEQFNKKQIDQSIKVLSKINLSIT
jgi:predicted transcriptional regulator